MEEFCLIEMEEGGKPLRVASVPVVASQIYARLTSFSQDEEQSRACKLLGKKKSRKHLSLCSSSAWVSSFMRHFPTSALH